ncbi:MAG: DUF4249 family protein [Flammeovirgaceae bacterium]
MKKLIYLFAIIMGLGLMSCEDPIDVTLESSIPQLTVDAWITNETKVQTVRLTVSQDYFSNTFNPDALNATVTLTDITANENYSFTDADNDGNYTYDASGEAIAKLNHEYQLTVVFDGNTFISTTNVNRTMPIDSVGIEYREGGLGEPEGHYASLYARDSVGFGDFYWIRTYKWDQADNQGFWLNKPSEINISADGTFSPNARNDNIELFEFILPIRDLVNPVSDPDGPDDIPPYEIGDSLYVELHGISEGSYYYLLEIQTATLNGGLFATPLNNVPTNIANADPNSTVTAIGWFGMSMVNAMGRKVE